MQTQILRTYDDPEMGDIGLILDEMRRIDYPMAAFSGLLVAHDVLEHQRGANKIGTIGDELVALGGVWYVRGQWGEISRQSIWSPHQSVASDVTNMGRMWYYGTELHFVPKYESDHIMDDDFMEIIEYSKSEIQDEIDEQIQPGALDEYYHAVLAGMRMGYDMAENRFNGECALSLFRNVEEVVESLYKMVYNEGQRFELQYSVEEGTARAEEIYDDEDY